jgi:hypothetical protein
LHRPQYIPLAPDVYSDPWLYSIFVIVSSNSDGSFAVLSIADQESFVLKNLTKLEDLTVNEIPAQL